ncbi:MULTISPECIES: hypothetical protein [Ramlibacter]|uniref:Uncharacterized protein n=1 Tax=Ramlibacter pinisoli TaxID=2682844 RepID=A0A6N8IRP2_9BURK|nr:MULTISPECIES: hypothetical protein [Ramlibacter]MBA2963578.1 hypothetical protein [Ramlibacter sp. CGMCC 1.13660]MVQ28543.1 hypothetical protein [Ramlibacter pinisoli]
MAANIWTPVVGWLGAMGAAFALALAAPNESGVLGKLPTMSAKRLDQTHVTLPRQLPSDRTVAVVMFRKDQREEAQRWIDGLGLHQDSNIAWVRLPVWSQKEPAERERIEQHLARRYPSPSEQERLLPLFIDRDAFVRAAGLGSTDHASVLVVDREGNVLAKAQGPFDQKKAQALRETVLAQSAFSAF